MSDDRANGNLLIESIGLGGDMVYILCSQYFAVAYSTHAAMYTRNSMSSYRDVEGFTIHKYHLPDVVSKMVFYEHTVGCIKYKSIPYELIGLNTEKCVGTFDYRY